MLPRANMGTQFPPNFRTETPDTCRPPSPITSPTSTTNAPDHHYELIRGRQHITLPLSPAALLPGWPANCQLPTWVHFLSFPIMSAAHLWLLMGAHIFHDALERNIMPFAKRQHILRDDGLVDEVGAVTGAAIVSSFHYDYTFLIKTMQTTN